MYPEQETDSNWKAPSQQGLAQGRTRFRTEAQDGLIPTVRDPRSNSIRHFFAYYSFWPFSRLYQ